MKFPHLNTRILSMSLIALCLFTSQTLVSAADTAQSKSVNVNGVGTISILPDTAIINLGIESKGPTARSAQQKNSNEIKKLMDALQSSGIAKDDIQTEWYNIYPEYDYSKDGNSNKIVGYRANHQLRVKVRDLTKVSSILETATASGVNQVNNISYTVEKKDEALDKARKLAAEDAQKKARKLADILGINLGKVLSVSEYSDTGAAPVYMGGQGGGMMESSAKNNVITPGKIEVRLDLNISYEIL